MSEESEVAMQKALDAVKLDADMRALAENAMQHFASVTAEPSAAQVLAQSQAESDAGGAGGGGMDAPAGMTVAPMVPEPYHPVSPFRLKFTFGSDGSYAGVTMEDPRFLWSEADEDGNPSVSVKTAGVGTLGLNGTVYLNITLSGEDGAKTFAAAEVSMSSSGDISVPLYELDPVKGAVKDYRHAMIALGVGGNGVRPDDVSTEFIPDPEEGEEPEGDEGKLQIKGFKAGEPEDENTLADYLEGGASVPPAGLCLVARGGAAGGSPRVLYIPVGAFSVVDLLNVKQTFTASKTFAAGTVLCFYDHIGYIYRLAGSSDGTGFALYRGTGNVILGVDASKITLGGGAFTAVELGNEPVDTTSESSKQLASRGWTNKNFVRKRSGTREYVDNVRYDISSMQLQKHVMVENLSTGEIVAKTGDGYTDGWTMITGGQAVPHSAEHSGEA